MRVVDGVKRCSACRIEKLIEAFNRNRSQPDGYQNACKQCKAVDNKNWKH